MNAPQLLEQGKYVIVTFEGYWYVLLPSASPWIELLDDNLFRTGFDETVSETVVREFYAKRFDVQADDVARPESNRQEQLVPASAVSGHAAHTADSPSS